MVRAVVEEATMDNREEIFDALNDFEKKPTKEIPPLLEQFLRRVAKTGETLFPWPKLKPLFVNKLNQVMTQFQQEIAVDHFPPNSNMEQVKFDDMRDRIIGAVERFHGAPFTIQRLCELITEPKRHYKRSDKFLRGIEKNVLVVSTVDPFGRKVVSESRTLVNGLDTNGCQPGNTFPPPPIPNWTTNNPGVTAVWPQTNIECTEEDDRHSNGKDTHPSHRDTELEEQREFEEKEEALNTSLERTEDEQLSPIKEEQEQSADHPSVEDADTTEANGNDRRVEEPVEEEESREVTPVSTSEADTVDAPPVKMRKIEEKEAESKSVPESSTEECHSSPPPQTENPVHPDAEAESVEAASEGTTQVSSTEEEGECESRDISQTSDSAQEDSPSSTDPPTQEPQEEPKQQQTESDSKLTEDLESKHTEDCDSTVSAVVESTQQTSASSCDETKEENGESSPNICEKSDPSDSSDQVMDTESESCRTSESLEPESSAPSKDQDSTLVQTEETDKVTQEEEPMDQD